MIYVTDTQSLFTDQGALIKHVSCPLASRLSRVLISAQS